MDFNRWQLGLAMSFQGKDFTPAMKQLVINLNTFAKIS